jgi:adenylate cyclase
MKLSPQLKMNIRNTAVITICLTLFNLFIALYNGAMITSPFSAGPSEIFDFKFHVIANLLSGLGIGILGGAALIPVNKLLFRRKSFRFALLTTASAYTLFFVVVTFSITSSNVYRDLGDKALSMEGLKYGLNLVLDPVTIVYFIMWGAITLLTLFFLQVNDKFGPGILLNFLLGKYHKPRKEERIFMFLDMRSSTSIAEKLDNEKYFHLLRDLFSDITNTILNNEGEIYQYVGDEIVISWPIKNGIRNANCLKCFVQVQQKLKDLAPAYERKYNIAPELKAGIHHGLVMAGEVGIIKKDIIYSGDVLNTTARIQEQCNEYGVDLLISTETFDLLPDSGEYELIPLGSIELRGKERKINLNTVKTN